MFFSTITTRRNQSGTEGGFETIGKTDAPTSPSPTTPSPTSQPTTPPPTRDYFQATVEELETNGVTFHNETVLRDVLSPQYQAVNWLVEEDELTWNRAEQTMILDSSSLIARYALLVLYYSTNGPIWKTNANFLRPTRHVCDWGKDIPNIEGFKIGVNCIGTNYLAALNLCK